MNKKDLAKAVDDLSSPSRRKRQVAAHAIAESMLDKPQNILSFTDDIFDALERPEAQTRWELLNSLTMIVEGNTRALAPAVHFAEPSLFDEDSSTVRLASFRFITAVGAQTKALSKKVWPMLEESIQVYHGDPQYREMLMAITEFVAAPIDPDIKKAVVARIKFDAKNSSVPIIKHLANDVLKAARGQKVQQKAQQKTQDKKNAPDKKPAAKKQGATKARAASTKSTANKKASEAKSARGASKGSSTKASKKATAKKPAVKKKAGKTGAKKAAAQKTAVRKAAAKPAPKKLASKTAIKKGPSKPVAKKAAGKTTAKKAAANKKSTASKKNSTAQRASLAKQTKTTRKTGASKVAPKAKKAVAAKKPSATKKAKNKIAGSKAAKALKKLTSKKSR